MSYKIAPESVPPIFCSTDNLRATLERTACACSCHLSSIVTMTLNMYVEDTVLISLPLTRSLHVGVIEAAAAFRLDGAMITDKHLMGLRCK